MNFPFKRKSENPFCHYIKTKLSPLNLMAEILRVFKPFRMNTENKMLCFLYGKIRMKIIKTDLLQIKFSYAVGNVAHRQRREKFFCLDAKTS